MSTPAEFLKKLNDISPSLCLAKWHDLNLWVNTGRVASCCKTPQSKVSVEELKQTLNTFNNSTLKQQERAEILNGVKPLGCEYCWQAETSQSPENSMRVQYSKYLYETHYANTALTYEGLLANSASAPVRSLTLSFDALCNFECVYCGPNQSSSWAASIAKHGPVISSDAHHKYQTTAKLVRLNLAIDPYKNPYFRLFMEWWQATGQYEVKEVLVAGGEPLMSPSFWKFVESLENTDISIRVTTNLGASPTQLQQLLKLAERNPRVQLDVSMESVEHQAEYIRYGVSWDQWCRNVETVLDSGTIKTVNFISTIQALAICRYADFLEWVEQIKIKHPSCKITVSPSYLEEPSFMRVSILPKHLIAPAIAQLSKAIQTSTVLTESSRAKLAVVLHRAQQSTFTRDAGRDFYNFFSTLDKRRNTSFVETFPELAQWYNSLNDNQT